MVLLRSSFFATLVLLATATSVPRAMVVHESRPAPAVGFVHTGVPPADQELTLRIALKQNNIAGLEAELLAVSTPGSARYGQHLTSEEMLSYVTPSSDTVTAVNTWLKEHNLTSSVVSPAGDHLSVKVPVAKANSLLGTQFSVFTHIESGETTVRTLEYSLPADIAPHVDFVGPTTAFLRPSQGPKFTPFTSERKRQSSSCNSQINPTCLQSIYHLPTAAATHSASHHIAVTGFIDQYANSADLKMFLRDFRPAVTSSFILETLDGGVNSQSSGSAGIEANLDVQYTVGVATGVPVNFVSVGNNFNDGVNGFIDVMNFFIGQSASARPSVVTTSYGFDERDLTRAQLTSMCNTYMQLGALGTSILFSSGDGGVSGSQSQTCTTFVPTAPSGCPYVTSVGSTQGTTEVAASFSSGGFSNYFPVPSFQKTDVSGYLSAIGTQYRGKFNATGRGFPDIALQGVNFVIASNGQEGTVDGTSCSSPSLASIIALVNDQLVAAGKPTMGYLNPFIYSAAGRAALNDVTSGSNPGCNTNGFSARAGWDPVTGLGTPNYTKFLAAALAA
ncbi:unnamed protein product [Mycena citricolor]|uniref:tripeptidyl-peptidase II n=1 Tax=Mycena citricolor TaxID=2018698 RepID=A0AAD2HCD8_9AGAR|nr:unnamed protein product [Mycena citricolor]